MYTWVIRECLSIWIFICAVCNPHRIRWGKRTYYVHTGGHTELDSKSYPSSDLWRAKDSWMLSCTFGWICDAPGGEDNWVLWLTFRQTCDTLKAELKSMLRGTLGQTWDWLKGEENWVLCLSTLKVEQNWVLNCNPGQTCDTLKCEESWVLCLTLYQTYDILMAELDFKLHLWSELWYAEGWREPGTVPHLLSDLWHAEGWAELDVSCILGGTCERLKGEQNWMPCTTFHQQLMTDWKGNRIGSHALPSISNLWQTERGIELDTMHNFPSATCDRLKREQNRMLISLMTQRKVNWTVCCCQTYDTRQWTEVDADVKTCDSPKD